MKNSMERIYTDSMEETINKFLKKGNDYFLTEKDLHVYFFHTCLQQHNFEFTDDFLLLHTEYPFPFKITKETAEILDDSAKKGARPHIDSVLFNKKYIDWMFSTCDDSIFRNNCIRGLENKGFAEYIKPYREKYKEFYQSNGDSILSHSLEFKFIRCGYEGISEPVKGIIYDLKKLRLIGKRNKKLSFPFSHECTLLVVIGERGNKRIVDGLDDSNNKALSYFNKMDFSNNDGNRIVIRYQLKR